MMMGKCVCVMSVCDDEEVCECDELSCLNKAQGKRASADGLVCKCSVFSYLNRPPVLILSFE